MSDLQSYARETAEAARDASRVLGGVRGAVKIAWLERAAELIRMEQDALFASNACDIEKAPEYGLSAAAIDRLRLTPERLAGISAALIEVAHLPDPVGRVIGSNVRPNGLLVNKVRVPLGVIFFIYESRPNVTADAAALCVMSGNAVILRGGKEAFQSNAALHGLLQRALTDVGLPTAAVQLVSTLDRAVVGHFLTMDDLIDVTIPRGGKSLIERVAAEARMPVIKHFDGNCHVYVDESADVAMAVKLTVDSKCQRPGVCNAAETLLVHRGIAAEFLPKAAAALTERGVELRCCEESRPLMPGGIPASEEDYHTEYLALILAVKVVDDLDAAVRHINEYGSHHTEAILTTNLAAAERFTTGADSAAVMVNASTRFNDGGELGLGAEIGISTDKFHARGPCGLEELTSYKYVVHGAGQTKG